MDIATYLGNSTSAASGVAPTGTAPARKKDLGALNQEDFMQLMLQQLKSQDPFKPTDNTQFIAQMAQLSSVTGISEMKNSLVDVVDSLRSSQVLSASNLLGRDVLVSKDTFSLSAAAPSVMGQIELAKPSQQVDIEIRNAAGEVVRRMQSGAQAAGPLQFAWDGKDDSGATVAAGDYKIQATAMTNGQRLAIEMQMRAPVTGVSLPTGGQGPQLQVQGLGTLKLSDVKEVG
ncbi:flagellar hook assembly protein FlgD [Perlucidibaca aquatica]|uniref:flagellar hook assembly protein FlgD n=1 Tax=Perlucidibaca aquatica TaxID=1852776 RepID=UPI00083A59C7|nr:flagellar hook assembly protein FlgD [Perlucidibaca aquatica]